MKTGVPSGNVDRRSMASLYDAHAAVRDVLADVARVVGAVDRDLAVAAAELGEHVGVAGQAEREHAVPEVRRCVQVDRIGDVEGAGRRGVLRGADRDAGAS